MRAHSLITGGGRLPALCRLAWPAIMEQLLMTMVSFVDTAMVGSLGAAATAAVSINTAPLWVMNGVLNGAGVGYGVQVSHAIGGGKPEQARQVIRQSVLGAGVIGLLMLGMLQLLAAHIPAWLGAEPEVLPQAVQYMRVYTLCMPFAVMCGVFGAVLRCSGDTRTPLIWNAGANILNIGMNYFLIFPAHQVNVLGMSMAMPGAGWGVAGAAAASAAAMLMAGTAMLMTLFLPKRPLHISLGESFRPDRHVIHQAVVLGLPYFGERFSINMGQVVAARVVAALGTVALAANHIAVTAEGICYLPAYGISFAATALVGQAVGARSREEADDYGRLSGVLGFVFCLAMAAAMFLWAYPLADLFSDDSEVVRLTARALRIAAPCEPFFALSIVLSGALRGAKDVRFPMLMAVGCMWGVRILIAPILVFGFHVGLEGIWVVISADLVLRGIICAWRWKSGRWVRYSGLENETVQAPPGP